MKRIVDQLMNRNVEWIVYDQNENGVQKLGQAIKADRDTDRPICLFNCSEGF